MSQVLKTEWEFTVGESRGRCIQRKGDSLCRDANVPDHRVLRMEGKNFPVRETLKWPQSGISPRRDCGPFDANPFLDALGSSWGGGGPFAQVAALAMHHYLLLQSSMES